MPVMLLLRNQCPWSNFSSSVSFIDSGRLIKALVMIVSSRAKLSLAFG